MWDGAAPWRQQGSFEEPVTPPGSAPLAAPLVSVCFSAAWLPYVLGALLQLAQPSSWEVADDAARAAVLADVTDLINAFMQAGGCVELRCAPGGDPYGIEWSTDNGVTWNECPYPQTRVDSGGNWQISIDGGLTWTNITGSTPGTPPNPGGFSTDQEACNIATHLATTVIQGALQHAVDTANGIISYAVAFGSILGLFPPYGPMIALGIDAAAGLIYVVAHATVVADYSTAASSSTLAKSLQCAIYGAIAGDGAVTTANFAALQAAVHAIAYTPVDVQVAIDTFITDMGVNGMLAAQQAGGLTVGDCSACRVSTPCAVFDGTTDSLSVTGLDTYHPASLSIIGWLNGSQANGLVVAHNRAAGLGGWFFRQSGTPSTFLAYDVNNGTTAQQIGSLDASIAGAQSFASTADGTTGRIYRNGTLLLSGALTNTPASDGTQHVVIGNDGIHTRYRGKMLDLRIYSGALSAGDIAAFQAAGPGGYPPLASATLVAQWKFNEGAGTTAADSSGNGHTATWSGTGGHWGTW
jgi:Concanavalin A-like lectin/glucanases superfamily